MVRPCAAEVIIEQPLRLHWIKAHRPQTFRPRPHGADGHNRRRRFAQGFAGNALNEGLIVRSWRIDYHQCRVRQRALHATLAVAIDLYPDKIDALLARRFPPSA